MAALFGGKDERQAAAPDLADVTRLEGLSLPRLAAEVMGKAFGPEGPGAPGRPGTIEAPVLSNECVLLADIVRAVNPAFLATRDAVEQVRIGNWIAEGLQALELAALIRVTWRGGTENFRATRRGREALAIASVERLVAQTLG